MYMAPDEHLERLMVRMPELSACRADVQAAYALLSDGFRGGGKLLLCGNGGSAADCEHIAGELMKGFLLRRPLPESFVSDPNLCGEGERLQGALPAIVLTGHGALASAFLNDVDPALVYAQQVYGYGRAGDVLLGISTSGNAGNVLHALRVARAARLRTIGLTGETGGAMQKLCDVCIRVPARETYRVQEYHLPVYHALCAMLEAAFFAA